MPNNRQMVNRFMLYMAHVICNLLTINDIHNTRRRQITNRSVFGVLYPACPHEHQWNRTDGRSRMQEQVPSRLTPPIGVILYRQHTRQASALLDTLNLGGFLFSGGAA